MAMCQLSRYTLPCCGGSFLAASTIMTCITHVPHAAGYLLLSSCSRWHPAHVQCGTLQEATKCSQRVPNHRWRFQPSVATNLAQVASMLLDCKSTRVQVGCTTLSTPKRGQLKPLRQTFHSSFHTLIKAHMLCNHRKPFTHTACYR